MKISENKGLALIEGWFCDMGIYLNPGNDAFQMSISDDIYVDKSEIIDFINNRLDKRKKSKWKNI